jgi:hypothetical protein
MLLFCTIEKISVKIKAISIGSCHTLTRNIVLNIIYILILGLYVI